MSPDFLAVSYFPDEAHYRQQCREEMDVEIVHKKMHHECRRFDTLWFLYKALRTVFPAGIKHIMYKDLKARLEEAQAVLALGGDNYSIDLGHLPTKCTDLDDLVLAGRKPMVIWGASVGPFDSNPPYEKYMQAHLRPIHLMAREPLTYRYLRELGLTENTHRVADPAFLMPPADPAETGMPFVVDSGTIGMNFSPLIRVLLHGVICPHGFNVPPKSCVPSKRRRNGAFISFRMFSDLQATMIIFFWNRCSQGLRVLATALYLFRHT